MLNHYATLGVNQDATTEEVKLAYRSALLRTHPDKQNENTSGPTVNEIQQAYQTLIDGSNRKAYDAELETHHKKQGHLASGDGLDDVSLDEFDYDGEYFTLGCPRCLDHHGFQLTEELLEQGDETNDGGYQLLVQCSACSLWLKVNYAEE